MTPWQQQIVVGTVLGGSSLVRPRKGANYYLAMADRDPLWLEYKMTELDSLFPNPTLTSEARTYRCSSSCLECLTEVHRSLYRDGRRCVTKEFLEPLRDIALAIWFLDGGGKTGRGARNIYLNTTRLGSEGSEAVCTYFCEMGMGCSTCVSSNRRRVIFSVDGTDQFFRICAHRFPSFVFPK